MKLTKHFTIEEMTQSETAARRGIDNSLPPELTPNILTLCETLENIRKILDNRSIIITSGYRCPELNKCIGGSIMSSHMQGLAADFICPSYGSPYRICQALAPIVEFDQLIQEFGRWVHIGLSEIPRQQILTAAWDTVEKRTVYYNGIHH